MAIVDGATSRESTKRELIEQAFAHAIGLAQENARLLSGILAELLGPVGPEAELQHPERVGWLGGMLDNLDVLNEYLEKTREGLQAFRNQTAPPILTEQVPNISDTAPKSMLVDSARRRY